MKKIQPGIFLFLLLLFTLAGCGKQEEVIHSEEFFDTFDTIVSVKTVGRSEEEAKKYFDLIRADFERMHRLFDIYHDTEGVNLKSLNDHAGKGPLPVDPEIMSLLKESQELEKKFPEGAQITLGSVLSLWHEAREEAERDPDHAKIPSTEELRKAMEHINPENLILDEKNQTVEITDPLLRLDVGSIAKGYATEVAMKHAQEAGMQSGIISAGGNVKAVGSPPGRKEWNIGLENPRAVDGDKEADEFLAVLHTTEKSVVTSGDYQRYFTVNGTRYHHIIDPKTAMPADHVRAVVVVTEDSGKADFLSTSLFVMPPKQGMDLVESLPDVEALWVFPDGTKKWSSGMKELIKEEH